MSGRVTETEGGCEGKPPTKATPGFVDRCVAYVRIKSSPAFSLSSHSPREKTVNFVLRALNTVFMYSGKAVVACACTLSSIPLQPDLPLQP